MTSNPLTEQLQQRIVEIDRQTEDIRKNYEAAVLLLQNDMRAALNPLLNERLAVVTRFHEEQLKLRGLNIGDLLLVTPEFVELLKERKWPHRLITWFIKNKEIVVAHYGGQEMLIVSMGRQGTGDITVDLALRMRAAYLESKGRKAPVQEEDNAETYTHAL